MTVSDLRCEECGQPLPERARFCGTCGAPRPPATAEPPATADALVPPDVVRSAQGSASAPADEATGEVAAPFALGPRALARNLAVAAAVLLVAVAVIVVGRPTSTPPDGGPAAGGPATSADDAGVGEEPSADPTGDVAPDLFPEALAEVSCLVDDERVPALFDGCLAWTVRRPRGDPFAFVAAGGEVVAAATQLGVAAFDAATGAQRWAVELPDEVQGRLVQLGVVGDLVTFVGADHDRMYVRDLASGSSGFEVALGGEGPVEVAAGPATIVVREPGRLAAVSSERGELRWERPVDRGSAPLVTGEGLVLLADVDTLRAWDLRSGEQRWGAAPSLRAVPPPVLGYPGVVVATTLDNDVVGVDAATGRALWRTPLPGVQQLVALEDGRVAAVTPTHVEVLATPDGARVGWLSVGSVEQAVPAGPGQLLAAVGVTLQRLDADLAGETWTLQGRWPSGPGFALVGQEDDRHVVVGFADGQLLSAFALPPRPPRRAADPVAGCEEARPSEALDGQDAWQGEHTHVALVDAAPFDETQVWVGLPGASPREGFALSARRVGDGLAATFRAAGAAGWVEQLEQVGGGRSSGGWPTHWVVAGRLPGPGCWRFTIDSTDGRDTVLVPLPAVP